MWLHPVWRDVIGMITACMKLPRLRSPTILKGDRRRLLDMISGRLPVGTSNVLRQAHDEGSVGEDNTGVGRYSSPRLSHRKLGGLFFSLCFFVFFLVLFLFFSPSLSLTFDEEYKLWLMWLDWCISFYRNGLKVLIRVARIKLRPILHILSSWRRWVRTNDEISELNLVALLIYCVEGEGLRGVD